MNGLDDNIAPQWSGRVVDISAATWPRRSDGSLAGPAELGRLVPNAQTQGRASEVPRARLVSVPEAQTWVSIDNPAA